MCRKWPMAALLGLLCFVGCVNADDERLPIYQPRFEREQPLVVVIAQNRMTELTDFVVPLGVLRRAGVARVLAVAIDPGPVQLMPALSVRADASIAEFQRDFPQGADYLIVPAVHDSQERRLLDFIRQQAALSASVIGICDGVLPLAHAGLLQGRRATGHWYSRDQRLSDFPDTRWQENRRYVVDGPLMTTAGVSAALPATLALVEAIAGTARAHALGQELGVGNWTPQHDSEAFSLGSQGYLTAAGNYLALWKHETFAVTLHPAMDEISLALRVDAWARTFRTQVQGVASQPVFSASGLEFIPQRTQASGLPELPGGATNAAQTLDEALAAIASRYGASTRRLVAAQLEYRPHERARQHMEMLKP
ncbi:DJ-1/PfpI family protein [Pseudomonas sp. GOM7]|uniref:DJ-1/PfpI family protein n=1 Tax=Pseudomonas sp. GOM7 TaxID=2998079 RepID=UPI00227C7E0E|nr:DJ-1/PfpI family protein [Pseudomonas sp. GOM7]WAJ38579.1 DJ-1/PfpI family protein [Pseudomonas sp. GOM7]